MNPIKNKKDLETTIDDVRKFAYSYLEKYNPSKQQLRTYLFKKMIKIKFKWFNHENQVFLHKRLLITNTEQVLTVQQSKLATRE